MVVPDQLFIAEVLLYSAGFEKAKTLARKLVQTLKTISLTVQESQHSHDFGLRAIKAIISIAERFNLQYLGLVDSDIPYLIDNDRTTKVLSELSTLKHKEEEDRRSEHTYLTSPMIAVAPDSETKLICEFIDTQNRSRQQKIEIIRTGESE